MTDQASTHAINEAMAIHSRMIDEMDRDRSQRLTIRDRRRVVHGWAFRTHTLEERAGIYRYLATGETGTLPEEYRRVLGALS